MAIPKLTEESIKKAIKYIDGRKKLYTRNSTSVPKSILITMKCGIVYTGKVCRLMNLRADLNR
jgi:hypothetical protein